MQNEPNLNKRETKGRETNYEKRTQSKTYVLESTKTKPICQGGAVNQAIEIAYEHAMLGEYFSCRAYLRIFLRL